MPSRQVACPSTRNSFLNSGICEAIKSIWRVATPRPIPTATHESFSALALGRVVSSRRVPWLESGDGLAFCCRSWHAAEERFCRVASSGAHRHGTLCSDRPGGGRSRHSRSGAALALREDRRRCCSICLWNLPPPAQKPSTLGRNANRFSRFVHLVLPDGLRARRRIHVAAHLAENVGASRRGWHQRFCSPSAHARFCHTVDSAGCLAGPYSRLSSGHRADRVCGL